MECKKHLTPKVQPLIPTELPQLPWQKVAMDLFEWKKKTYLLIVDYYSRYIEIALLNRLTSEEVVAHCQSIFARHGIPEQVVSDNGHSLPQKHSKCLLKVTDSIMSQVGLTTQWGTEKLRE